MKWPWRLDIKLPPCSESLFCLCPVSILPLCLISLSLCLISLCLISLSLSLSLALSLPGALYLQSFFHLFYSNSSLFSLTLYPNLLLQCLNLSCSLFFFSISLSFCTLSVWLGIHGHAPCHRPKLKHRLCAVQGPTRGNGLC